LLQGQADRVKALVLNLSPNYCLRKKFTISLKYVLLLNILPIGIPAQLREGNAPLNTGFNKLQLIRKNGIDTIVCGGVDFSEILACPSAPEPEELKICLLDCYDVIRVCT
jgi:hypothetical protein